MTINKINSKGARLFIFTSTLLTLLFTSCKKAPVIPATPSAAVSISQGSPDEPPLDVFVDNQELNQTTVTIGESSGYISVAAGKTPVAFKADATMKTILADTINFNKNTSYSLFLVNTVRQPGVFLLTDTLNQPTPGNAAFRFVNLSPDAPAVDLVIKGGAVLVSNRSYKGYSSFALIPGNKAYTFEIHQAGTATVLATFSTIANLSSGSLYTIWLHGLAAGTTPTDELAIDIINNANFL